MNLVKSIIALLFVALGQGNILMQNYALLSEKFWVTHKETEVEYHKKYKTAKYNKQKVASFKDHKELDLVNADAALLVSDDQSILQESQNDRFDFNSATASWFACCGHA